MKKNKLFKDTVIVVILVGVGKILGFLKEMFVAKQFGVCYESDVFFFAFGMTSILFSAIGSSIGTSFIPVYSQIKINSGQRKARKFLNKNVNLILILSLMVAVISILFSKQLIFLFAPGLLDFDPNKVSWAISVTRIMMISIVLIGIQSILSFALNAEREYTYPAASNIIFNFVCIIYLFILSDSYGVKGLTWSVVVAFFVQTIFLYPRLHKKGYNYSFDFNFNDIYIKKMFKLMLPVIIGSTINQVNLTVDKIVVSFLGEGAISNLNYANKLTLLIYGVIALLISGIIYNEMVESVNCGNDKKFLGIINNSINISVLIILPISIFMFIFREPIICILFKGGAFTQQDVINTANVFMVIIPTMVLFTIRDIITRAFYAINDTKSPMKNGVLVTIINIILSIVLSKIIGIQGVALATTIAGAIGVITLMYRLKKKLNISINNIVKGLIFSGMVSSILCFIAWKIIGLKLIVLDNKISLFLILAVSGVVFILAYSLIICILYCKKVKELRNNRGE